MTNWILTDPDCYQYGKKINDTIWEYIELREVGDFSSPFYWVYRSYIDLDDYTSEEIDNYVTGYYENVNEVHEIYGDDANQIIIECIFENLPAIEHGFVKEFKFESDAVDFIHKYIREE